ncbi:hypothetical protein QJS10_CPB18g00734 [Acorus calamus]|uniref:Uncharacterized protein n=1 Tax=Acorus calamus TaxID=4465 RepID=A0AAV9CJF0_ACOCL|nr:hypothetical protein QJS10_CPB18g00734 [Acorus calamus]
MIRPKDLLNTIPNHIREYGGGKYYLFFKDCVGAIDGTHVHVCVNAKRQLAFRSDEQRLEDALITKFDDNNVEVQYEHMSSTSNPPT